ncbi:hypothetical protein ACIQXF_19290 [Lysinibacillus sp. NPDC097231]|uniref:hypothetical protein n=1 Tax=Lysinibacillus sp. NPDC097231 TaxID=3364142 RepID=UPI00381D54B0
MLAHHHHVVDFRSDWALSWGRPMSRFASLQGLICDANPQGVAQSPLQSIYINGKRINKCHPKHLVMTLFVSTIKNVVFMKEVPPFSFEFSYFLELLQTYDYQFKK